MTYRTDIGGGFSRHLANIAKKVGVEAVTDGGSAEDGLAAEMRSRLLLGLDSPGTGSSSSTSSASSPQSERSGTSSRSLRGLASSTLVAYLPVLLFAVASQILRGQDQDIDASDKGGTSRP
jgi:hypothetical protein